MINNIGLLIWLAIAVWKSDDSVVMLLCLIMSTHHLIGGLILERMDRLEKCLQERTLTIRETPRVK